jgi:hypothetical protein
MPQPLNVLLNQGQLQTLLDDDPGDAVLQVEHVLCVFGQCSHAGMEVRALGVRHGLEVLLPHGAP